MAKWTLLPRTQAPPGDAGASSTLTARGSTKRKADAVKSEGVKSEVKAEPGTGPPPPPALRVSAPRPASLPLPKLSSLSSLVPSKLEDGFFMPLNTLASPSSHANVVGTVGQDGEEGGGVVTIIPGVGDVDKYGTQPGGVLVNSVKGLVGGAVWRPRSEGGPPPVVGRPPKRARISFPEDGALQAVRLFSRGDAPLKVHCCTHTHILTCTHSPPRCTCTHTAHCFAHARTQPTALHMHTQPTALLMHTTQLLHVHTAQHTHTCLLGVRTGGRNSNTKKHPGTHALTHKHTLTHAAHAFHTQWPQGSCVPSLWKGPHTHTPKGGKGQVRGGGGVGGPFAEAPGHGCTCGSGKRGCGVVASCRAEPLVPRSPWKCNVVVVAWTHTGSGAGSECVDALSTVHLLTRLPHLCTLSPPSLPPSLPPFLPQKVSDTGYAESLSESLPSGDDEEPEAKFDAKRESRAEQFYQLRCARVWGMWGVWGGGYTGQHFERKARGSEGATNGFV